MGDRRWRLGVLLGSARRQRLRGAIRHAVEAGINWIDTAAVYGLGHSEQVVARALADFPDRDRPFVFTKGGLVWDEAKRRQGSVKTGNGDVLRRGVDDSLRRLGIDRIDLYFMHWPAGDGTSVEDYWQTLVDLRAAGKLRTIGLSNHDRDQLDRAEAIGHVDVVQPPLSAINPSAAHDILPWCVDRGAGTVVYSPMGSGLLTGRFSRQRVATLAEDDWRRTHPAFTIDLDENLSIAQKMAAVAERYGVSTSAVAVAWVLGIAGVSGAIVGARTPAQVDDWVHAAELTLTPQDYVDIGVDAPRAPALLSSTP